MKTYKVKVNGKTYVVELESIEETNKSIEVKEEVKKEESKSNKDLKGATTILAPIQGTVLNILVKVGQKVKRGDVLLLIEAMKLENEVNATVDGEVAEILVTKGQNVSNNDILIVMK